MKVINAIILSIILVGICACESTGPSVDELAVSYCELFEECSPNFGPTEAQCIQAVHEDLGDKEGECYSTTVAFLECLSRLSCEEVETEVLASCYAAQDAKLAVCR